MIYLVAFVCPPLALLIRDRPGAALINIFIFLVCCAVGLLFFIVGVVLGPIAGWIHGFAVLNDEEARRRHWELLMAMQASRPQLNISFPASPTPPLPPMSAPQHTSPPALPAPRIIDVD